MVADLVHWSPDGSHFIVSSANNIDVYSVETASVVSSIDFKQKVSNFAFVKEDLLAVGGESEFIRFYDLKTGEIHSEFKAHKNRVKAISCVSAGGETFLVTTSSDGYIKVWYLDLTEIELKPKKIAKANVGNRPTCMTVLLNS